MNFYKRFMADYAKKTARLTLAQHGAYTLLLDELYISEAPLPAELDELYRICRAMSSAEREAVRTVAEKHFPIGDDGLRSNARAMEEIAEAAPAIEAARVNGKKGGRPKKPTTKPSKKPTGLSDANQDGTQNEPGTKAPQSSDTSTSLRSVEGRAARLPKPLDFPDDWRAHVQEKRPELDPQSVFESFCDFWHAKPGKDGTKLDWPATFRTWVRNERAPIAKAAPVQSFRQADANATAARVHRMTGGLLGNANGSFPQDFIDMEEPDAPAIANG